MEQQSEEDTFPPNENASSSDTNDKRKRYRLSSNIELPIFLIMFAVSMGGAAITNLVMYRTCVHSLGNSVPECRPYLTPGRGNTSQEMEDAVQKYSTFVSTVRSVLESLLPALLSLFMVVWSDKHGRKPLIVWPMLGITLTSMMVVVYSMLESLGPWWYIATCVPYSLSGGFSIMATASMCFVTDLTTEKNRSLRIMLVQATFAAGVSAGSLASPYMLKLVGGVYLLLISAAMNSLAYAFAVLCIEESILDAVPGKITTILNPNLIKQMFRECFKRRPNRLRAQILLVTSVNSLSTFAMYGVLGLGYLYTRETLHWGLQDYTQYSAVSTAISFVGSFLGVAVIQKFFKIGDLAFSIVACLSTAVGFYIKGMAAVSWHMYLASLVSAFGDLSSALIRSLVTKIIPSEDVAKVFALMCAVEGICPMLAPVVYNALYAVTITSFPGAVMMVTSDINIICVVLLGIVAYFRWNSAPSNYTALEQEVDA